MKSVILALLLAIAVQSVLAAELTPHEIELRAQREQANTLRKEAKVIRKDSETIYRQEDAACVKKSLVNACRQNVRESYIAKLGGARTKEIEANRIDTAAKGELAKLHASKQEEKARSVSASNSAPSVAREKLPHSGQTPSLTPERVAPPPPSAQQIAATEARKQRRTQQAEQARAKEDKEAQLRAQKAKQDVKHYADRAKIVAERKKARAEKEASQSAPTLLR